MAHEMGCAPFATGTRYRERQPEVEVRSSFVNCQEGFEYHSSEGCAW